MPIASTVRRAARPGIASRPAAARLGLRLACVLCLALGGCAKPQAIVVDELLAPLARDKPWLPGPADLAAADLATAALVTRAEEKSPLDVDTEATIDPRVEEALARFEGLELNDEQDDLPNLAVDLRNATLDDPIAYREASRRLRKRFGLDPRLKGRLDRTIQDDPLRLAGRRQFDGWHRLWARTFNSVAQPLGNSAITGFVIAPFQLANSLIHYFAEFSNSEPLSLTDRQALALRQEFVERHPDSPIAPAVQRKIDRDVLRLEKTLAIRRIRSAEKALDMGEARLAAHQAENALEVLDQHPDANGRTRKRAQKLLAKTEAAVAVQERRARRSLQAIATRPEAREAEWQLSAALLARPLHVEDVGALVADYRAAAGPQGKGRIEFIRANARIEDDFEAAAREQLRILSAAPADRETMARHARTLLVDDWQNPYGAFVRLHRKGVRAELGWRLAGEWVNRPRYPNLPAPLAYLIDTPTIAITIILAPLRAMISPWTGAPDFQRGTALAGYRYLTRFPNGEEQTPLIDWLYAYEVKQERWGRALRMADWIEDFDPEKRTELVEKTAVERLAQVEKIDRRDTRASMLHGIAREFPDSAGGRTAGMTARSDREDASPQSIRITKSFLLENPTVAGPEGAGLNPRLLNDDPADGELHPEGIVLRGGRVLEIRLVADGGDHKGPPVSQMRKISERRLRRIAATLEEAVQRNSLIDEDARFAPDANRDLYLERAGLGLTEDADGRPTAESDFVYQSLRERYGMVRGRDSILPFDLVFRGSLGDFTLGAFPRWRVPKQTPDAFLYR